MEKYNPYDDVHRNMIREQEAETRAYWNEELEAVEKMLDYTLDEDWIEIFYGAFSDWVEVRELSKKSKELFVEKFNSQMAEAEARFLSVAEGE